MKGIKPWLLLVLLLTVACREELEPDKDLAPVTLSPVLARDLLDRIEATGELQAVEKAEIAAEVGGRITEILIDEGLPVEAGAEVMSIDPERRTLQRDSAGARVDEARARVREAEREFARLKDLRARKVASQTQLDSAETELKLARSRLVAARADSGVMERAVRDAQVTAPFSGIVARRLVSRGEYVQPGTPLFDLVSLDPVEVEFSVAEVDSGRVSVGQEVEIRVAPHPDETFAATVTFVSPTIDTRTRTLRVKAQLPNPYGRLRPGLFARVNLGISERKGVAMVLEEAILQRADGAVLFRVDGKNRAERVRVATGVHREGWVEILTGVSPGDLVVSRGHARLGDGEEVVPRRPDGTLATNPLQRMAGGGDGAEVVP